MSWIDDLEDASFRGVPFQVQKDTLRGGRRLAKHEYPKRDVPYVEDLGAKAKQFTITAYLIGTEDVFAASDRLLNALDTDGSGLLIHPSYRQLQVNCEDYTRSVDYINEQNVVRFQIVFVESGDNVVTTPTADTAQASATAADNATSANASSFSGAVAGSWGP